MLFMFIVTKNVKECTIVATDHL